MDLLRANAPLSVHARAQTRPETVLTSAWLNLTNVHEANRVVEQCSNQTSDDTTVTWLGIPRRPLFMRNSKKSERFTEP